MAFPVAGVGMRVAVRVGVGVGTSARVVVAVGVGIGAPLSSRVVVAVGVRVGVAVVETLVGGAFPSPQHTAAPFARSPQVCSAPALMDVNAPVGGVDLPELLPPQHTAAPFVRSPQAWL